MCSSDLPNNAPPTKELNHAAFLVTAGGGKTVALVHCAMVLAHFMGWWSGHVCAVMPRDTYDGNPLYGQMLRPGSPVIFGTFAASMSMASGAPTFGTPGLLWASLTLAILAVPVVIVATEEALAAVPTSMRES